jgi:guanylate kinase
MTEPDCGPDVAADLGSPADVPRVWPYNEVLPPRAGLLVVLSGPSAAGKDALLHELRQSGFPITKVVTVTTRAPRPGEVPGKDYHFVTREEFARLRDADKLLEWAEVYGTPYGTPADEVRQALDRRETVLLKIDVQGAAQVKQKIPDAVFIYLGPGSFEELVERLRRRATETDAEFQRRVDQAREELRQLPRFDYLVVNREGQLARAVKQVKAIIVAERLKVRPRQIRLP